MRYLFLVLVIILAGCSKTSNEEVLGEKHDKTLITLFESKYWKPKKGWTDKWLGCCAPENNIYMAFVYKKETIRYYWNGECVVTDYEAKCKK